MSNLKDLLSMSRHERIGTLVVLAFMAIVIAIIGTTKSCSATTEQTQQQELEQWAAHADSARMQAALNDSIARANSKAALKHDSHKGRQKSKQHKKQKSKHPTPTGLPEPIPNY